MSIYVGGVQQQVVQVGEDPLHVEAVYEALDNPTILGPSVFEAERHTFKEKQTKVANECRQALAGWIHWNIMICLSGVQGGEHLGPGQALQHVCNPRGGE